MVKILLVEDDKIMNNLVSTYLRNNGYEVKCCFNGLEALDALETNHYSMILSDVMMPQMDGFELAESIRLTDKTTPIIFMTAKDDKPSKLYGYKICVDDYITKPFDIDILMMKVTAILRRAKIENEKVIEVGDFITHSIKRTTKTHRLVGFCLLFAKLVFTYATQRANVIFRYVLPFGSRFNAVFYVAKFFIINVTTNITYEFHN